MMRVPSRWAGAVVLLVGVVGLAGCAGAPAPDETASPDPTEDAHPIATFEVAGSETYRIELATPELVAHAERLLAGEDVAAIPLGTVVRDDPGVNEPWTWHIDPATLEFADITIEVCDGLPSHVEDGVVTSDQYCPWSARIVSID